MVGRAPIPLIPLTVLRAPFLGEGSTRRSFGREMIPSSSGEEKRGKRRRERDERRERCFSLGNPTVARLY